jgi:glycosyltransferase involved in cell wall biosynthesis
MSKIIMIVSNPCIADARVIKMAQVGVKYGHEVHIFATLGKHTAPFEEKEGVFYHRLAWGATVIINNVAVLSILNKINKKLCLAIYKKLYPFIKHRMFSKLFADHISSMNPDIIHAHDLICLPTACNASKDCNAKIIYDAHELEIDRFPPLTFLQKICISHVEKKYSKKAHKVITVGKNVGKILAKHIKRKDIEILYNAPILKDSPSNIRDDLGLNSNIPLIIYVGKITVGRGIERILDLIPVLKDAHFAAIGPCDKNMKSKFISLAHKKNISGRFSILPPVSYDNVVSYIQGADMGIILLQSEILSHQNAMPNKFFEMSFANIPIIANDLSEIGDCLKRFKNGTIIDFEDRHSVIYNTTKFFEERSNYKMSTDDYNLFEQEYSWDKQTSKLGSLYEELSS